MKLRNLVLNYYKSSAEQQEKWDNLVRCDFTCDRVCGFLGGLVNQDIALSKTRATGLHSKPVQPSKMWHQPTRHFTPPSCTPRSPQTRSPSHGIEALPITVLGREPCAPPCQLVDCNPKGTVTTKTHAHQDNRWKRQESRSSGLLSGDRSPRKFTARGRECRGEGHRDLRVVREEAPDLGRRIREGFLEGG